ncbi:MAG: exosortase/archaeosortase family protein [Conexivisphaerales archaeon]
MNTLLHARKSEIFVISVFAAYLIPLIIPGTGIDYPFVFTVGIILFAWFVFKWNNLKSLNEHPKIYEVVGGITVVALDFTENAISHSNLGLIDMLLIFMALSVAFYGIRSIKFFYVPYLYLAILITGYQVENNVPELLGLQYSLAGLMADFMRAIGVSASVNPVQPNIVYLQNYTPDGSLYTMALEVDGPCTGLKGILAFGLLSSMALLDARPTRKQLIVLIATGFTGAFLINIVRLAVIFLTFEYLGVEAGKVMHVYAGYTLFIVWVIIFWSVAFRHISTVPSRTASSLNKATKGGPTPGSNI